jgi:hypothetical protein
MPASLQDVLYVDLDPADVDAAVQRIARDVRRHSERRAKLGDTAVTQEEQPASPGGAAQSPDATAGPDEYNPVLIVGIVKEGVGKPRNDGTRGSALYRIPLRLSRRPSEQWSRLFVETWNHPPRYTTMHRPGIASVRGDTIVLDGTEMHELEQTLKHVIAKVNDDVARIEAQENAPRAVNSSSMTHTSATSTTSPRVCASTE